MQWEFSLTEILKYINNAHQFSRNLVSVNVERDR